MQKKEHNNTNDENTSYYTKGDSLPTLFKGGRYDIRVYD